jgi:hypothetical protein
MPTVRVLMVSKLPGLLNKSKDIELSLRLSQCLMLMKKLILLPKQTHFLKCSLSLI